MTTLQARPSRNPRVLAQRAAETTVLLDPDSGEYFSLDEVGSRIWELCDGSLTLAEIASRLGEEFDADAATIHDDAREFVAGLAEAALLHTAGE